jgi:hypothetical protein
MVVLPAIRLVEDDSGGQVLEAEGVERRLGDMVGGAVDTPSAARVYLFPP